MCQTPFPLRPAHKGQLDFAKLKENLKPVRRPSLEKPIGKIEHFREMSISSSSESDLSTDNSSSTTTVEPYRRPEPIPEPEPEPKKEEENYSTHDRRYAYLDRLVNNLDIDDDASDIGLWVDWCIIFPLLYEI